MLELYKTHGTTLCGLVREGHLSEARVADFLRSVHDVPLEEDIHPDEELRRVLLAIPHRRWVFTASTREHAQRCLRRLGIEDLFLGIVACSSPEVIQRTGYVSKHDAKCFEAAMELAGVVPERAAGCMLLDDSASNLRTAKAMGWQTVLVGLHARNGDRVECPHADVAIGNLHELPRAVPVLFDPRTPAPSTAVSEMAAPEALSPCSGVGKRAGMAAIECVFFDCDDCLYKNGWATAARLNAKFGEYCETELGVPAARMLELYKTHGTTLCGLVREGHLSEARVADFLRSVHDVPLEEDIHPDEELRRVLLAIPHRRWVFTASTREHAQRCLRRLGIEDLFLGIVACSSPEVIQRTGYVSKHDAKCFKAAMELAGVSPERAAACMLLDDSASNLRTAKATGWQTVLVGLHTRNGDRVECPHADVAVDNLHELPRAVPVLFEPRAPAPSTAVSEMAADVAPAELVPKKVAGEAGAGESVAPGGWAGGPTVYPPFLALATKRRCRELKPLASSPVRRVLRRVSTPLVSEGQSRM